MKKTIEDAMKYEQKSKMFLYPLLNLPTALLPIETYLFIENLTIGEGTNLICLFHNENAEYKENKNQILFNPHYELTIVDNEFDLVIFNLSEFKSDYAKVIAGDYRHLSDSTKIKLKIKTNYLSVMHALNPSNYYKEYADYLECDLELLEGHGLVMPPDKQNETLVVTKQIKSQLMYQFAE